MSAVPEHWFPLIPRREHPEEPALVFVLGGTDADGAAPPAAPLGRLLRPPPPRGELVLERRRSRARAAA